MFYKKKCPVSFSAERAMPYIQRLYYPGNKAFSIMIRVKIRKMCLTREKAFNIIF